MQQYIKSEYDFFDIFVPKYLGSRPIALNSCAYVHDCEEDIWYKGCVVDIVTEGDPLSIDSDYNGEAIVDGIGYAIGINVDEEIPRPNNVEEMVVYYC